MNERAQTWHSTVECMCAVNLSVQTIWKVFKNSWSNDMIFFFPQKILNTTAVNKPVFVTELLPPPPQERGRHNITVQLLALLFCK